MFERKKRIYRGIPFIQSTPHKAEGMIQTIISFDTDAMNDAPNIKKRIKIKASNNSSVDDAKLEEKVQKVIVGLFSKYSSGVSGGSFMDSSLTFAQFVKAATYPTDPSKTGIHAQFHWKISTRNDYYNTLKNHFFESLSKKPLVALTADDFTNAVDSIKDGYSEATVKGFWTKLCRYMDFAVLTIPGFKNCVQKASPYAIERSADLVKRTIESRFTHTTLSCKQEAELLFFLLTDSASTIAPAGMIMLFTGIRPSENTVLTYADLDWDPATRTFTALNVTGQYDEALHARSRVTKTANAYRKIPLSPILGFYLSKRYHQLLSGEETILGRPLTPQEEEVLKEKNHISYNDNNSAKPYSSRLFSDYCKMHLDAVIKNANCLHALDNQLIPPQEFILTEDSVKSGFIFPSLSRCYMLRHTFCTRLAAQGFPEDYLDYLMGHSLNQRGAGYRRRNPRDYANSAVQDKMRPYLEAIDRMLLDILLHEHGDSEAVKELAQIF